MPAAANRQALLILTLALVLGIGGCSTMRWHKAGGDDAALARDLAACRKEAQDRFGGAGALALPGSTDPRFGPMGPSPADQRMQESQAHGTCMRQRGYTLVPSSD
jgi:uncharacterized protein YceK